MAPDEDKQRAKELDNSRILDVHKWSEHPEVNNAVDALYAEFLELPKFKGQQNLQKKHIKVIVLYLYVRSLEDKEGYISFYRMKGMYEKKSRYNQLHISFISVAVIDNLEKLGYLDMIKGHYDRTRKRPSHMSRMRATDKLIDLIVNKHGISQKMTDTINPYLEGYVRWTDFHSMVLIKEDPTSKESRELERSLREHQGCKLTKGYYYQENI